MLRALPPVTPGVYPGDGQASLLRANQQQYLMQNQAVSSGQSSVAVQLERLRSGFFYANGVSFEITFSGSAGTFQVDVQTSDTDKDSTYVTISSLSAGLNSSNVGRIEIPSFWAKFVRVKVTTITNPVNITILVTR